MIHVQAKYPPYDGTLVGRRLERGEIFARMSVQEINQKQ